MARVVLKWDLTPGVPRSVPAGEVRHVGFQRGQLFAWVEHDYQAEGVMTLHVVPTGTPFDHNHHFVGTAVSDALVWHVYVDRGTPVIQFRPDSFVVAGDSSSPYQPSTC